jgi:hypothetical protein
MKKFFTLTNSLLIVSILMASLFIYITYGTYKSFSSEQKKMQAFYITNAGINQAVWYLSTPTSLGGYGPNWRVKNLKEYFSVGSYTISVKDGKSPGEIIITSIGEMEDITLMLQAAVIYGRSIPNVFNYAIFSDGELDISGSSLISGNVYVNDNLTLTDDTTIVNGSALTTPGYNIITKGKVHFMKGKSKRPFPSFPVLDTTFYYNKISHAKSGEPGVIQGDVEYKKLDLAGKTIYVNGNVTLKGSVRGPGSIVSTRNMTLSGRGEIGDGIYLICNGKLSVSGSHNISGNSYFYSKQRLSVEGGTALTGGAVMLSPTVVDVGDKSRVAGLIYGPSVHLGNESKVEGSVAAENFAGALKNVNLKFKSSSLPLSVLGFNVGSKVIMRKPGALKEI